MRLTNKYGLPAAFVAAVANDPYSKGACDISVTSLIAPAYQRRLMQQHADEIEEDASERIWSILGQSAHVIVQRAAEGTMLASEERLFATAGGLRISGQLDLYDLDTHTLSDLKVTSVWAVLNGLKSEWAEQLNVLCWLLRRNGQEPRAAQIVAVLRDWSQRKAAEDQSYPQAGVVVLPARLWSDIEAQAFVEARVQQHTMDEPPICTAEERWRRPTTYAVVKNGNKRASRVLDTREDAELWMLAKGEKGLRVEERPGEDVRCEGYCPVSAWCGRMGACE